MSELVKASACSILPYASSLLFEARLAFVLYITLSDIWKANLDAFYVGVQKGSTGVKGRQNRQPPTIPQGNLQEGQHDRTPATQKHMHSV